MIIGTEKVIFDTNSVRCEGSSEYFLGGRSELERFIKVAKLFLPEIVIDEIREQKRRHLTSKRDSFLGNIFHKLREVNEIDTQKFNITAFIESQRIGESISYSVLTLKDHSVLLKIKDLAVFNQAPFEEDSDKGFKDAYIYFTILEFLGNIPDERIFFVTKDERLKEAFALNERVQVIEDFEDFQRYRTSYIKKDYFLQKLQSEIDKNIQPEHIRDAWLNINSNLVVSVETGSVVYRVEVDFSAKEIIDHTDQPAEVVVDAFKQSGSFSAAHECIAALQNFSNYLSDSEVTDIIEAAVTNPQIYRIAEDNDVKEFVSLLWDGKKDILSEELRILVNKRYKLV